VTKQRKTRGEKMKVSPTMSLKTHVEKMSVSWLATMLMKINELNWQRHDVYDNKAG
jgi:hypothetical protein